MAGDATSREASLQDLLRYCRGAGERVYVLVDAAQNLDLARAATDQYGQQILTLFEEPGASRLRDVGPYLVPVDLKQDYLELWGRHLHTNAGILLLTEVEPQTVRTHLRTVFRVSDEEGEEYFFRFYDPRVLRAFLPTCTPQEAKEFFGPVRCILVEGEQRGVMLSCRLDVAGVKTTERCLVPAGSASSASRTRP